jgi:D-3-phosphoglycerate dehydrogenase / 2-oxoglutarate reductase
MNGPAPVRVLVIGDPYLPASAYAGYRAGLGDTVAVTSMQISGITSAPPRTESERRLAEYVGNPADIVRAVAGQEVLIVHGAPVTAEVLDAAPVRLVRCARGGPVNVDVAAATDRGIPVASTPGKSAEAVAELTIALALLLVRAVPRASRSLLERGSFAESVFEGSEFFGREAASLTLGLAGLGRVGREVALRARALGFGLLGYDPLIPEAVVDGVDMVPLNTLLERSDIVSLHARATAGNRHMFSYAQFVRMRPGACFINTGRESLVDEPALLAALQQGTLGGAGLDVLERPPAGTRHPLLDAPNVFVTPHIGGATAETLALGAQRAVAAVTSLLAGRVPDDVVNPQALNAGRAMT